jgi:hypothetical protein
VLVGNLCNDSWSCEAEATISPCGYQADPISVDEGPAIARAGREDGCVLPPWTSAFDLMRMVLDSKVVLVVVISITMPCNLRWLLVPS